MTKNLKHAVDDWPMATRPAQLDLDERWQPVLKQILTSAQRAPDTPLRFGIDSEEIVAAALKSFSMGEAAEDARCSQDWTIVSSVFESLLKRGLVDEPAWRAEAEQRPLARQTPVSRHGGNGDAPGNGARSNGRGLHPLAAWLEQFYGRVRGVHPRAIEIVALRMEEYTSREIAQRLGIGLRLVHRIIEDARLALSPEVHS
jgi:hypothetical protein